VSELVGSDFSFAFPLDLFRLERVMARFRIAEVFTTFKNYLEKEIIALTSSDADWGGVRRDELFLFTKEKLSDGEAAPDGTCVYAN
jgi:hypothetical protein